MFDTITIVLLAFSYGYIKFGKKILASLRLGDIEVQTWVEKFFSAKHFLPCNSGPVSFNQSSKVRIETSDVIVDRYLMLNTI